MPSSCMLYCKFYQFLFSYYRTDCFCSCSYSIFSLLISIFHQSIFPPYFIEFLFLSDFSYIYFISISHPFSILFVLNSSVSIALPFLCVSIFLQIPFSFLFFYFIDFNFFLLFSCKKIKKFIFFDVHVQYENPLK